jgi:hypothetical protein
MQIRCIRCSYGINGIKPAKANERKIGNREKLPKLAERFLHGLILYRYNRDEN